MTFCPDCEQEIPDGEFVAHREREHPADTKIVTVHEPIRSEERILWEG